jgi:hypothetical protein
MAARKYEFMVGQHGYWVDLRTLESIPGSDTKPELVTAIDARDVDPLVEGARQLVLEAREEQARGVEVPASFAEPLVLLLRALAPFDSEES